MVTFAVPLHHCHRRMLVPSNGALSPDMRCIRCKLEMHAAHDLRATARLHGCGHIMEVMA